MAAPTRRFLLRTSGSLLAGGVLAGCIKSTTPGSPTQTTNTTHDTRTDHDAESDIQRRVSLASVDSVPDTHDVRIEVELLKSTVTPAHTAHLRITATNERSAQRRITIGNGQCSLFNRNKGESEPSGLWLHRPNSTKQIDRKSNRWTADRDPTEPRAFLGYGCTYPPTTNDEPIVNEYLVWDDYQVDGYMTAGTYRFATSITVGGQSPVRSTPTATDSESTFVWGFDLSVENPDT